MIDAQAFKDMMSSVAASVTVVTCEAPEGAVGITVSAFTAVSASPPVVLVCVDKSAGSLAPLSDASGFTVNFLPDDADDVAMVFATRGADKFAKVATRESETESGGPILEVAFGHFVCETIQVVEMGDHWVFFGQVVAGGREDDSADPLVYLRRSFVKLAS